MYTKTNPHPLRRHRLRADVSLRQLAEVTGLSFGYIGQIERGLRTPSPEALDKLAAALEIPTEILQ